MIGDEIVRKHKHNWYWLGLVDLFPRLSLISFTILIQKTHDPRPRTLSSNLIYVSLCLIIYFFSIYFKNTKMYLRYMEQRRSAYYILSIVDVYKLFHFHLIVCCMYILCNVKFISLLYSTKDVDWRVTTASTVIQ